MNNTLRLITAFLFCFSTLTAQLEPVVWENINSMPGSISSLSEYDGKIWVISAENLYFSEDDGMSWSRHEDFLFNDLEEVTAGDFGVTVTRRRQTTNYTSGGSITSVTFYHAPDGSSFSPVDTLSIANGTYSSDVYEQIFKKSDTQIVRIRGQQSIAFGTYTFSEISEDGGQTWTAFEYRDVAHHRINYNRYNDTLSVAYPTGSDSTGIDIYTAADTPAAQYFFTLPADFTPVNTNYRFGKIISLDNTGQIAVSDDAGENWLIEQLVLLPDEFIRGIKFATEKIAIKTSHGLREIAYDALGDAPLVFSSLHVPAFAGQVSNFYFETENALYYTDNGTVQRRAAGSEDFTVVDNGLPGEIDKMWVVGDYLWALRAGLYYTSDDAGLTWTVRENPEFYSPNGFRRFLGGYGDFTYFVLQGNIVRYNIITQEFETLIDYVDTWYNLPARNYQAGDAFFTVINNHFYFFKTDGTFVSGTAPAQNAAYVWYDEEVVAFKDGQRYSSADFGQTWTEEEYAGILEGDLSVTETGLLSCGSNMYRSIDGGYTWIKSADFDSFYTFYGNSNVQEEFIGYHDGLAVYKWNQNMYFTADEGGYRDYLPVPFYNHYSAVVPFGGYVSSWPQGPKDIVFLNGYIIAYTQGQGIFRTPYAPVIAQLPNEVQLNNVVSGRIFKDLDGNCNYTTNETALAEKTIIIGSAYGITNSVGRYAVSLPVEAASYDYATDTVRNHETICTAAASGTTEVEYLSVGNLDIPFHSIPDLADAEITILTGTYRPGFTTSISVRIKNFGSVPLTGLNATAAYDASFLTIVTSDGTAGAPGELSFPVDLDPDETVTYYTTLETDATTPLGTLLDFNAEIEVEDDIYSADNIDTIQETVVGAYDPNDKTAYTDTEFLPYTPNEILYRIRFQNTGTDTAFTVRVRDTLTQNLDLLSFEMIEASHPYELKIEEPRTLEWTFSDILLPDSTTNEPLSHGYIFFKINTADGLPDGAEVANSAAIYFDFNAPVITEDELLAVEKGTIYLSDSLTLCQGDIYDGAPITEENTFEYLSSGLIYDTLQTVFVEVAEVYEEDIFAEGYAGTEVGGILVFNDTTFSQIYQTWQGCDSIVNYTFSQIPYITVNTILHLCVGDLYEGIPVQTDFIQIDTTENNIQDSIIITEVNVHPVYYSETEIAVSPGSFVRDVQVFTDTLLQFNYSTAYGCDSLIVFDVMIISPLNAASNSITGALIFPNPTADKGYLAIYNTAGKKVSVVICDVYGKSVNEEILTERTLVENEITIDLQSEKLPPGVWYILLKAEKDTQCLRLIKID